ncbi:histidine kinase [Spongiactinospora gelatinilytica]|uniref:histidine kinase n=1 Tax=Spongiactinospora gelatinilytica TaxID=2666298 RepID=A0A2W2FGQ8_9ACTN|nr:sensor histidine kinase [Spongiactinospora gelatinilytica]PZG27815.1 histidine kinase [Spongiactinospora gelatinilytica]
MRLRKTRLGTKVVALLVSLSALWAFAAWVTMRDGLNLLWVTRLDQAIAAPSEPLLAELQRERRLTLVRLGAPGARQREALTAQQARTDAAIAVFETEARSTTVRWAGSDTLLARLDEVFRRLESLKKSRKTARDGTDQNSAAGMYSEVIDSLFRMYDAMATLDDEGFAKKTWAIINLNRARELLAREDAMLGGMLAGGRIDPDRRDAFVQLVGARRHLMGNSLTEVREVDPVAFDSLSDSGALVRFQTVEDVVIANNGARPFPVSGDQWRSATTPALAELEQTVNAAGDRIVEQATPIATGVVIRLALAGGLGLLAVIASIVLSITTARDLVRQLDRLRTSATELARERLPGVVERLGHGEKVDVATEAPPLRFGDDQIGQVGQAFNEVQETAIRVAVEQAELRRSIREILLSLARRTQSLVHRQLALLDTMERRESDPSDLKDLFRVDHLATRMRRNAENLIVLSGSSPARSWRRPVPMIDVVRGALAEVEDYTRVSVPPMGEVALVGRAVGDVIHLLAELIENAVSYSPPYTTAEVHGQIVANGYVIEIEDRGLGMSAADLAAANDRIVDPPEFDLRDTSRLGLFVVSRLAERHGIKVSLKGSPYGGTTAVILLPPDIVLAEEDGPARREIESGPMPAITAEPWGGDPEIARRTAAVLGETSSMSESSAKPALTATTGGGTRPEPGTNGLPPLPRRNGALAVPDVNGRPASRRALPQDDAPARGYDPLAAGPVREELPDEAGFTPGGLPFRVPQASLAPALRAEQADPEPAEDPEEDLRSPEEIRRIMGSYQAGTMRGRMAAEQAHVEDPGRAPRHGRDPGDPR